MKTAASIEREIRRIERRCRDAGRALPSLHGAAAIWCRHHGEDTEYLLDVIRDMHAVLLDVARAQSLPTHPHLTRYFYLSKELGERIATAASWIAVPEPVERAPALRRVETR